MTANSFVKRAHFSIYSGFDPSVANAPGISAGVLGPHCVCVCGVWMACGWRDDSSHYLCVCALASSISIEQLITAILLCALDTSPLGLHACVCVTTPLGSAMKT